jgi:anti-sigma B factor antagonist
MEITARSVGNCIVLDCIGKLTLGPGTKAVRDAVRGALEGGPKKVVVNLARVDYIDSTGIGELVSCFAHAQGKGGRMVLLNLNPKVHQLLAIAKLHTVFEIFQEEKAALAGC